MDSVVGCPSFVFWCSCILLGVFVGNRLLEERLSLTFFFAVDVSIRVISWFCSMVQVVNLEVDGSEVVFGFLF